MRIVRTISELVRDRSLSLGFVPTMGAFHEGHLSLMRTAKSRHDSVVVSLFVNPTQFGQGEDFERYPRNVERDAEMAETAGVDCIFAPTLEEMYPRKTTQVCVSEVTALWEGASRPGHFTGVSTVVAKLFNIVQPDEAYFGLKDLQQCLVIRRMVEDLDYPVKLNFQETVREPDGLALSSRNVYLSESDRAIAPNLYREICLVKSAILDRNQDVKPLLESAIQRLSNLGFRVEYLEWVDLSTMSPQTDFRQDGAIVVAAKLGTTRLIDNVIITPKSA